MNYWIVGKSCGALSLLLIAASVSAPAQTLSLVSAIDASQSVPVVGGGDSSTPIISPDGRYVLFASTANNLSLTSSNTALPALYPPPLNVFLRDRANGTTTLVSVNLSGAGGGNGDSIPVGISTNGRYAAFESSASNLVPGDTNGVTDIFVRDLALGTTVLVSLSTNGTAGNGASRSAAMTPDGRYVAFVSGANNLVDGDTNGIVDVFVRDLQTKTTTLASAGALPVSISSRSESPDITPDGRYVAFYSTATNLVAGVLNAQDIYVRDLVAGTTIWASAGAGAAATSALNGARVVCYNHAISADGKYVAYEASPASSSSFPGLILRYSLESDSTELIHTNAAVEALTGGLELHNLDLTPDGQHIVFVASTNSTSGATTCILLWDAATGLCSLVSADRSGQVVANANCDWPSIDPTGQLVTFSSTATGLTTNALVGLWHLYLRDLQAGTTLLLDADAKGVGSPISPLAAPCLSANAQWVAFECKDGTLVANDRNLCSDVVARDLQTGALELVSAHDATLPSLSPNGASLLAPGCVSSDGRYVAFASNAENLVTNDNNGFRDIFVRDQLNATNFLASVSTNGAGGNGISYECALSADGRYVAFTSQANNLVAGDTNGASDVFVRDLQTGITRLVSVNSTGTGPGSLASYSPVVASGGRYVMFRSKATNLAAGTFSGTDNLFVRDLQSGTNYALTTSGVTAAAMTPDGRYVAYLAGYLYVWASATATKVYTGSGGPYTMCAISPDGSRLAYWGSSATQLTAKDWNAGTTWTIGPVSLPSRAGLHFSADNRFLTYAATVNKTNQVYFYDLLGKTSCLVSHSYNSSAAGNGSSDSPDISADGRFIAYRSTATNLVPGDTNGQPDIFLYDRQTGATTLLSVSPFGNFSAVGSSVCPVFSADGQTLLFQTWAEGLTGTDFNQTRDVVAYSLYSAGAIPVFSATVSPSAQGPQLTWPVLPGKSYHVQFKNSLNDPWQELNGNVTIVGSQGFCQDFAPSGTQRFYRIVGN